jgi:WD40 repeat protein
VTALPCPSSTQRHAPVARSQTLRVQSELPDTARVPSGVTLTALTQSVCPSSAVSGSMDGTLRVWDLAGHQPPRVLEGHTGGVGAVALTADGKRAVSGSSGKTLRVWDLEGHQPPRVLKGHRAEVRAVALRADGQSAVSGSDDKTVRVWDLESGKCLVTFTCDSEVLCCAWAGGLIAAGDAGGQVHFFAWQP